MKVNRFVGFMLVISTIVILGEILRATWSIAWLLAIIVGILLIPPIIIALAEILHKIKY